MLVMMSGSSRAGLLVLAMCFYMTRLSMLSLSMEKPMKPAAED